MLRGTQYVAIAVLLMGCYELQPVRGTTPEPGAQVAFDVTDVGRVALGGSMGPEIGQIEGRLVQRDNGEYLLGVTSVSLLRGGVQVWKGEQVRLKPEYVGNVYERRLDKGRTAIMAALTVGAVVAIATQNPFGSSNDTPDRTIKDTSLTRRSPGTFRLPIWSFRIPHLGRP